MNIVDLVGEYVSLKKSGQAYQGLCPFHSEKSASFYVHPLKQVFRCFGCQKGGNVFTFLMNVEGLNFPEAVQKLADRTGVQIEKTGRHEKVPTVLETSGRQLAALDGIRDRFHLRWELIVQLLDKGWVLCELVERPPPRMSLHW